MSSDPFIGQIQPYAGTWIPEGWALCDGSMMLVRENPTLFSILGTTYGGDGRNVFALPDLRGRVVVGAGKGPSLTPRTEGQSGGEEAVTLTADELPSHTHPPTSHYAYMQEVDSANGTAPVPANDSVIAASAHAGTGSEILWYVPPGASDTAALGGVSVEASTTLAASGESRPHPNLQPWTALSYIIAIDGLYPPRPK